MKKAVSVILAAVIFVSAFSAMSLGVVAESTQTVAREFSFAGNLGDDTTAICYFSEEYFCGSSKDYNNSLATLSLCFDSTCNSAGKGTVWTKDVNTENAKFKDVRDLLTGKLSDPSDKGLGFTDFAVNDDWQATPRSDTIGAVAARKQLADGSTLVAVGLRGLNYFSEWAGNFAIGKENEHEGFNKAKDGVLAFLDNYFAGHDFSGTVKLWIVGYSRSAAVANLVTAALDDGRQFPKVGSINKDNIFSYCFSAPMATVSEDFDDEKYENIHNVLNYNDLVPFVAPSSWDFTRFNKQNDYYLPNKVLNGDNFETLKKKAVEIYNNFKNAQNFPYIVSEYTKMFRLNIDWSKIITGEKPVISPEYYEIPTHELAKNTLDIAADDLFEDRENYYDNYQELLCGLLEIIMQEKIQNEIKTEDMFAELFSKVKDEDILDVILPMIEENDDSYEVRLQKCQEGFNKHITDYFAETSFGQTIEQSSNGIIGSITALLWNIFKLGLKDLFLGDATSISTIISLVKGIADKSLFRAHFPEINLAWLMSLDKNYTGTEVILSNKISKEKEYKVNITRDGKSGLFTGSGKYTSGSTAILTASAVANRQFDGWYKDGKLLSTDSVYKFTVKEDMNLVAKFSEKVTNPPEKESPKTGEGGFAALATTLILLGVLLFGFMSHFKKKD